MNNFLNFKDSQLSRTEMKNIVGGVMPLPDGGGTCNAKCSMNGGDYEYASPNDSLTKEVALSMYQGCKDAGGVSYWCCDSCYTWHA